MIRSHSEPQEGEPTLILNEREVQSLFEVMTEAEIITEATQWVEKSFLEQDRGALRLHRRVHVDYPEGRGYEDGSVIRILPGLGVAGFRAYPDHHDGMCSTLPERRGKSITGWGRSS